MQPCIRRTKPLVAFNQRHAALLAHPVMCAHPRRERCTGTHTRPVPPPPPPPPPPPRPPPPPPLRFVHVHPPMHATSNEGKAHRHGPIGPGPIVGGLPPQQNAI